MATWIKDTVTNTGYYQISTVEHTYVKQWVSDPNFPDPAADNKWYIWIDQPTASLKAKGPYADQVTAQTTLDNAITTLGGAV